MSYRTWIEYGYGIKVDDIKVDPQRVLNLLDCTPIVKENFFVWLKDACDYTSDEDIKTNLSTDDIADYEGEEGLLGIGNILKAVISENENIDLVICDNYESVQYLLYVPSYPWYMSEKEKDLKEEDIAAIMSKYVRILTDAPVTIDYYECENGG